MLKKLIKTSNYKKYNCIECNELTNDTLIIKYSVNVDDVIKVKENQFVCMVEKGKLLDTANEIGEYKITETSEEFIDEYKDTSIRKTEEENLCVVFVNNSIIENNKYYIKEPIEYIDWTYPDEPLIVKIKGEGIFSFQIVDSIRFLKNMVIGLRNHYSKQELIEQIRNYIVNSIIKGINEVSNEYKININEICEKSKDFEIKLSTNIYDEKLLEKGIKITFFDIEKLEIDNQNRYTNEELKNDEDIHKCKNCGTLLKEEDSFCRNCGTLNN